MAQQTNTFAIRREDKNLWEKRTPLVPEDIIALMQQHNLQCQVQSSPIRIFSDDEFRLAGIPVDDDISSSNVFFSVKEMPNDFFQPGKVYVFFSHTTKGQSFNMPMLKKIVDLGCTLIDYEKIVDSQGRRIIFFGRYAGLAGMIDTLWSLGQRLLKENCDNPFVHIQPSHHYRDLQAAKKAVQEVGELIKKGQLANTLVPFITGFTGYGNVSQGAQEIYDLLPSEEISPNQIADLVENQKYDIRKVYKVVFKEQDLVCPLAAEDQFELQDYYQNPHKYKSQFDRYIPFFTVLIHATYWDDRYPRLVTKEYLKDRFKQNLPLRLRVIGDISCDVEGSVESTVRCTEPDNPVFVYDPITGSTVDGFEGKGIVIMAVDNLPGELPRESSTDFSASLRKFIPGIVKSDYSVKFADCDLPEEIKRAVIVYNGSFTPEYVYMRKYI